MSKVSDERISVKIEGSKLDMSVLYRVKHQRIPNPDDLHRHVVAKIYKVDKVDDVPVENFVTYLVMDCRKNHKNVPNQEDHVFLPITKGTLNGWKNIGLLEFYVPEQPIVVEEKPEISETKESVSVTEPS